MSVQQCRMKRNSVHAVREHDKGRERRWRPFSTAPLKVLREELHIDRITRIQFLHFRWNVN